MKHNKNQILMYNTKSKLTVSAGFITYTCTNHPEVIENKPGKCPKCGKVFVKKY